MEDFMFFYKFFYILCFCCILPDIAHATVWKNIEEEYAQLEYTPQSPYIKINPFKTNPLVALLKFSNSIPVTVTLKVKGKGNTPDLITYFNTPQTEWTIPVYGLYPKFNNTVELTITDDKNTQSTYNINIKTDAIPIQNFWITSSKKDKNNYFYFTSGGINGPEAFILDEYDNVRYFFNPGNGREYQQTLLIHNRLIVDRGQNTIEIYSLLGEKLDTWKIPASFLSYQHDISAGPNNSLLIIGSDFKQTGLIRNKELTLAYDKIIVTDLKGNFIKLFDMSQILNPDRAVFFDPTSTREVADWLHLNSVEYIKKDNSLLISGKHLGIFKIDYKTSQLKWLITPHLELEKSGPFGKGKSIADKALNAVDQYEKKYPQDIQKGYKITDDFHWPMMNHCVHQLPNGDISVFSNNGKLNNEKLKSLDYSDILIFNINEQRKTVKTRNRIKLDVLAPIASSAVVLNKNEIFILASNIDNPNTDCVFNKFYRYNLRTGEILFENDIFWKSYFFQAKPVSFQNFADNF